jgi:hypothetical protein
VIEVHVTYYIGATVQSQNTGILLLNMEIKLNCLASATHIRAVRRIANVDTDKPNDDAVFVNITDCNVSDDSHG